MTVTTPTAARRVLIAEDEALIRLDLKEMLEEEGYDVCGEAGDGERASYSLRANPQSLLPTKSTK